MAVIKKVYKKFPKTQAFIDKSNSEECGKENIFVDQVFLALMIVVDIFMFYDVVLLYGLLWKTLFSFTSYRHQDWHEGLSIKKNSKKDIGEVKKELLQSILEEKPENAELIYKLYHALTLENAPKSMKQ